MSDSRVRDLLPRRIGIHGMRSAGKTCFLGTLYGFRAGASATVDFADDATCLYLGAAWKDLSEGRVPGATLLAMPASLRLDLTLPGDGPAVPLELRDYAGLLVEPKEESASPVARELAGDVKAWFRSCHAVLVFLDSSRPDLEQVDALDLLLTTLRKPGSDGAALERPVAIVLTKWDSQGVVGDDLGREQERARAFLATHHAFRQVGQKLDAAQVRIFPVSSFGNHARGTAPPELSRYHPCHLHAPLAWAAAVSDLVLLEEARGEAEKHLSRMVRVLGIPVWPRPDHGAAQKVWRDLSAQATPGHGPLAEHIAREIKELETGRRQHWGQALLVLAIAAVAGILGFGQAARAADAAGGAVLAWMDEQTGPDRAESRKTRADEYLASWWSRLAPARRSEVAARREADAAILEEQDQRSAFVDAIGSMERQEKWGEAYEAISAYLARYPATPLKADLDKRKAVARRERDYASACAAVEKHEKQDDLDSALAACEAFLKEHPGTSHQADMESRLRDLKRSCADRAEYERIRRFARTGDPAGLEEAARLARDYLRGGQKERSMRKEAERFNQWFDRLKEGGEFEVVLESLVVPPKSDLSPVAGQARTRVHVSINGRSHATPWMSGANLAPGTKVGLFPFRWGEPGQKMLVRVEGALFVRTAWAEAKADDPLFVLGKANGTVQAKCRQGREVAVGLRCAAAAPPDLPAYRRR